MDKKLLPEGYIRFLQKLDEANDGCPDYEFIYGEGLVTSGVLWNTKACESYSFSETEMDYAYFRNNDDFDWADFDTFDGDSTLSNQEIDESLTIGLVDEGFIIINTHDQSVWMIFSDYFMAKCADSFDDFLEKKSKLKGK